ncbi:hypothetical protein GR160_06495 [Flavobacterium sp. Sd200]|uniref:hypothetical protein n=1 Tax=Flavobacterium sp. Sd200 TaxID=2692211 RepID=UPI00136EF1DC|nr:hypothetical protein [Flavobacterium sp. Sd200]MXN90872.1 hypothetical protein [Flavobacterium sp. Sd200]
METTFHFSSADEISPDFIETLKAAFKKKPIAITVEEDFYIPAWQKEETLKRKEHIKNHPDSLTDFDIMMAELEQEMDNEK